MSTNKEVLMASYKIDYKPDGDSLNIVLSGSLNENVVFGDYPLEGFKKITFNLSGVVAINSIGIREWLKWFSQVGDAKIEFNACPKVLIEQFNMIDSVKPKAALIVSFYVPYYNEEKNIEKNILFVRGKDFDENGVKVESVISDGEGGQLEIDVIADKYFQFLKLK